jgi:hypothetical protein
MGGKGGGNKITDVNCFAEKRGKVKALGRLFIIR